MSEALHWSRVYRPRLGYKGRARGLLGIHSAPSGFFWTMKSEKPCFLPWPTPASTHLQGTSSDPEGGTAEQRQSSDPQKSAQIGPGAGLEVRPQGPSQLTLPPCPAPQASTCAWKGCIRLAPRPFFVTHFYLLRSLTVNTQLLSALSPPILWVHCLIHLWTLPSHGGSTFLMLSKVPNHAEMLFWFLSIVGL